MWSIGGIRPILVITDNLASLSDFGNTNDLNYGVVTIPRLNRFNDRVTHRPVFRALEPCRGDLGSQGNGQLYDIWVDLTGKHLRIEFL